MMDSMTKHTRANPMGRSESNSRQWMVMVIGLGVVLVWLSAGAALATSTAVPLLVDAELATPPPHIEGQRWRPVRVDEGALGAALREGAALALPLFGELSIVAEGRRVFHNRSGSTSWVGAIRGEEAGLVVLVSRQGVTLGSIRTRGGLFLLSYAGQTAEGGHMHVLHQVDEDAPSFHELPPTPVQLSADRLAAAAQLQERMTAGQEPQDDGSIQDLLVVYTPRAVSEVGGVVAMENLIDLGVTETNLSYEFSGIAHRLRLVHTAQTDFDEMAALGDPRDLLQGTDDGVMDEVHGVRDQVAADLVKLILSGGVGCGRAFIMNEISVAFEAFAFCWTSHVCLSPGYTFQHELGHIQAGRHQRNAPVDDSPFPFNFGYTDPVNRFRTIMAAGDAECPNGCPRRLAWSNPDVDDPKTGAPMGIPEGDPLAADMRKTLNATAWVVANFRVSNDAIFSDDFESGDLSAWTLVVP